MKDTIKDIIDDILARLEEVGIPNTKEARALIYETAMAETGYRHLEQMGDGPAVSFWQIEPATAIDNCQHYLKHRKHYLYKCAEVSMVDIKYWQNYSELMWSEILESNLSAAIIHCRLKYWRVPKRMPNTLEGRAKYWKKYYNSEQGAGTEEKYIETIKGMRDIL